MAQGDFTKEEAKEIQDTFAEIYKGLTKKKQGEFFGHANDVLRFLSAAERAAPPEFK